MKRIIYLSVLLLLIVGGLFTSSVSANDGGLPYTVEPIFPDNQDEDINHYISITHDSNSLKQELEFLITNKTNQKEEINIKLFNAYTSGNGGIQYTTKETENNSIIDEKYEMIQYLQAPDKIVLEGGESKVVQVGIDIPDMEGTVLGAVAFEGKGEDEESEKEGISFEIKNEINTIYGIAVNFPTEDNYEFQFDKPYLDPMPSYYVVRLPITLNSPLLFKNGEISYVVEFEGEEIFFSKETLDFAPMTKTNFSIPFDYEEIEKNKPYTLKGTLTYDDKDGAERNEEFEFSFVYEDKEKKEDKDMAKTLETPVEKDEFPYWILLLLLIPLVPLLIYLNKRRNEYVLFSNTEPVLRIDKENPLFEKIQRRKQAINTDEMTYAHYYIKKKNKHNDEYHYAYRKTKTLLNKED